MKTILLANRLAPELSPLTELTCAALLRVAGKPLLIHAIESVAAARLTDIIVVVAPFADHVEKLLGDGVRWGMRFTYLKARGDECPDALIRRLDARPDEDLLVVRGEILRTPIVAEFVARAVSTEPAMVAATIAGIPAGILLVRAPPWDPHQACNLIGLARDGGNRTARKKSGTAIDFSDARLSTVESLRDFHRANLDAAAGRFPGLIIPGRKLMPGVTVGRKTRLPTSALKGRPVFVGSRCRVAADAELMSEVVVSSDVVIDRRATLRSAVIMPHTYIGELVEVVDAIVSGHMLIHVETGVVTRVTDSFLLASVTTRDLASPLRTMADSLGAILLLILSLPLWPIALLVSLAAEPSHPIRRSTLLGNRLAMTRRVEFTARQFSASLPILRYLPYLFSVAAGHLRLVGVEPLAPAAAAARTEQWEFVRDEAPAGLFGPVQLTLSADAPRGERRLMEAYYARTRSLAGDLRWLALGVVSIVGARAVKQQAVTTKSSHGR
jgi:NDP-sugar pyrophosphorylase family protein